MEIQGEHMRELELQLKDEYEAVSKLESRIAELEKTLKKPEKELMEMTVQTAANS
jgi:septal ring factor EnvC (AmiA/AmiB activator)